MEAHSVMAADAAASRRWRPSRPSCSAVMIRGCAMAPRVEMVAGEGDGASSAGPRTTSSFTRGPSACRSACPSQAMRAGGTRRARCRAGERDTVRDDSIAGNILQHQVVDRHRRSAWVPPTAPNPAERADGRGQKQGAQVGFGEDGDGRRRFGRPRLGMGADEVSVVDTHSAPALLQGQASPATCPTMEAAALAHEADPDRTFLADELIQRETPRH